jgi:predicted neutral ceramidase superfamily lipid hydrolase
MAEDEKERLDRELIELLNELRVIVTGVQMLFAFLLTVAFSQRFGTVTPLDRYVYFATVLSTALSSAWLIAPAAYHRLLFRYHEKQHMVVVANRMAITGLTFLALSITGVLFLITDVLFGGAATVVVTVLTALLVVGLWFVWPLTRRGERLNPFDDS